MSKASLKWRRKHDRVFSFTMLFIKIVLILSIDGIKEKKERKLLAYILILSGYLAASIESFK